MVNIFNWYVLLSSVFVFLTVCPWCSDVLVYPKNIVMIVSGLVGCVIWALWGGVKEEESKLWKISKNLIFIFLLFLFGFCVWLTKKDGYQNRTLLSPMGLGSMLGFLTWYFLVSQLNDVWKKKMVAVLGWVGAIASVVGLVLFLVPERRFPLLFPSSENAWIGLMSSWSVFGDMLTESIVLVVLMLINIAELIGLIKKGKDYIVRMVMVSILSLGFCLSVYKVYKYKITTISVQDSWAIAVEAFKRTPVFGSGIGNFSSAFHAYKPIGFNYSKVWNMSFTGATVNVLNWWTEYGLAGLVFWIIVLANIARGLLRGELVKGVFLVLAFLPGSLLANFLFFVLLGVFDGSKERMFKLTFEEGDINIMPIAFSTLIVGILIGFGIFGGREVLADYYMKRSIVEGGKGNGLEVYNWQRKAVGMCQKCASMRRQYSNTNLSLALGILLNKEAGDKEKEQASVLLQQAVREGKEAVSLETGLYENWAGLAGLYRNMMGVVDGATDWAIESYKQAIMLDGMDPFLKIDYGGVLYASGRYEEADRVFESLVSVKNDFANGWYNWAHTAKKLNRLGDAVYRLRQAVALVSVDSDDYEKASQELATWEEEYKKAVSEYQRQQEEAKKVAEKKQEETLKVPEPIPSGGVDVGKKEEMEPPKN